MESRQAGNGGTQRTNLPLPTPTPQGLLYLRSMNGNQPKGDTMNTPLDRLRYHTTGAVARGEKQAIVGILEQYCKIRFVSKYHHGATAGLILSATALKGKSIADVSRYFPVGEFNKMDRLERSPFFNTWDEAFAYTFAEKGKKP